MYFLSILGFSFLSIFFPPRVGLANQYIYRKWMKLELATELRSDCCHDRNVTDDKVEKSFTGPWSWTESRNRHHSAGLTSFNNPDLLPAILHADSVARWRDNGLTDARLQIRMRDTNWGKSNLIKTSQSFLSCALTGRRFKNQHHAWNYFGLCVKIRPLTV